MFEWLSDNRATVAMIVILFLLICLLSSIVYGIRQTKLRDKEQVFGHGKSVTLDRIIVGEFPKALDVYIKPCMF